jgi:soluble lytic murein transglycosylase-like protein
MRRMQAITFLLISTLLSVHVFAVEKPKRRTTRMTPQLARQIVATARQHGLEPWLVLEVMRQESAFNPKAKSNAGAAGLMQFMPATAARFDITDPYDPEQAIEGGCRYLVYLLQRFNGRLDLALAGYNAGEHRVEQYGMRIPPFRETQIYVRLILIAYNRALQIASKSNGRLPEKKPTLSVKEIKARLVGLDSWGDFN